MRVEQGPDLFVETDRLLPSRAKREPCGRAGEHERQDRAKPLHAAAAGTTHLEAPFTLNTHFIGLVLQIRRSRLSWQSLNRTKIRPLARPAPWYILRSMNRNGDAPFWSAPAERSGDGAFEWLEQRCQ